MKRVLAVVVVLFFSLFVLVDIVAPVIAANIDNNSSTTTENQVVTDSSENFPPAIREREEAAATGDISLENIVIDHSVDTWIAGLAVSISGSEALGKIGAITTGSNAIAFLTTNPPVEMGTYVADVLQNTGLASPAYAQGIGFSALTPVLRIWKAFRNIAYFFIIIFFIIAGFMIMFRRQIDHSTVVTLQMALPKIIVTLIIITFSYAIAGFVVDLIYLIIFIITEIFQTFGILTDANIARNVLFGKNILGVGWKYLMGTGELAGGAAASVTAIIENALNFKYLGWLTSSLGWIIIAVAILIALFRTLFALIGAYVGIIISVIFAPIQLLFNALPGSNTFNSWIRGLVANAAVFPAVAIMVLVAASLTGVKRPSNDSMGINVQSGVGWGGRGSEGWVPPLIGQGDGGVSSITGIIGLGMIMLLPEVAKMIKEALEVKDQTGELAAANLKAGASGIGKGIVAPFKAGFGALYYGKEAYMGYEALVLNRKGKKESEEKGDPPPRVGTTGAAEKIDSQIRKTGDKKGLSDAIPKEY